MFTTFSSLLASEVVKITYFGGAIIDDIMSKWHSSFNVWNEFLEFPVLKCVSRDCNNNEWTLAELMLRLRNHYGLVSTRDEVRFPRKLNTRKPEQNGRRFAEKTFWNAFSLMNSLVFWLKMSLKMLKFVPKGSNWQDLNVGSGNGFVPNRRQAISWPNVDRDIWHHMAPQCHIEINHPM